VKPERGGVSPQGENSGNAGERESGEPRLRLREGVSPLEGRTQVKPERGVSFMSLMIFLY